MPGDMGIFRVDIEIENPARPGERRTLSSVLVDTGAELSWVPAEVLESLGSSGTTSGTSARPTEPFSSAGPAGRTSLSPGNEPMTMSFSESPAILCCWAHARSKGSTFG